MFASVAKPVKAPTRLISELHYGNGRHEALNNSQGEGGKGETVIKIRI